MTKVRAGHPNLQNLLWWSRKHDGLAVYGENPVGKDFLVHPAPPSILCENPRVSH
jgi:hypothetical protein